MRYQTRFITCGIITLALALAANAAAFEQRVPARVTRVLDGDTVKVEARVWPGLIAQTNVRVRGVDTPEIRRPKCGEYERRRGLAARDFVRGVIGEQVWLINVTHGKFGRRVVASVLLADGRDLATLLLATGHALPYRGGRRPKWC
ncbi:MAG: thermonuclease family protein [Nitrospinae bacterium]|nr:thermonuclease family protein [Nitrospinota bacterium]